MTSETEPTIVWDRQKREAVQRLEARHWPETVIGIERCHGCSQTWPCDTELALASRRDLLAYSAALATPGPSEEVTQ